MSPKYCQNPKQNQIHHDTPIVQFAYTWIPKPMQLWNLRSRISQANRHVVWLRFGMRPKSQCFSRGHNGRISLFASLKFPSIRTRTSWNGGLFCRSPDSALGNNLKNRPLRVDSPEACWNLEFNDRAKPVVIYKRKTVHFRSWWTIIVGGWSMFGKQKKQPSMIFPSNIPNDHVVSSQVTRICHWCWDCRGNGST